VKEDGKKKTKGYGRDGEGKGWRGTNQSRKNEGRDIGKRQSSDEKKKKNWTKKNQV